MKFWIVDCFTDDRQFPVNTYMPCNESQVVEILRDAMKEKAGIIKIEVKEFNLGTRGVNPRDPSGDA